VRGLVALALLLAGAAQAAEPGLTEASVRAFVARQEAAWNAKDARAWSATFAPDAVFIDRARDNQNRLVDNGRSTLPQAVAQARRFFAKSSFAETAVVDRVVLAPDGRSAQVFAHETIRIEALRKAAAAGPPARTLCTESEQTLVLAKGRLRSRGQTDTAVRCPH